MVINRYAYWKLQTWAVLQDDVEFGGLFGFAKLYCECTEYNAATVHNMMILTKCTEILKGSMTLSVHLGNSEQIFLKAEALAPDEGCVALETDASMIGWPLEKERVKCYVM